MNLFKRINLFILKKPVFFLFLIALVANCFFFVKGFSVFGLSWDNIYKLTGDSTGYVESVDELLKGNEFHFFKTSEDTEFVSNIKQEGVEYDKGIYFAFRSPGFAYFYTVLRLLLPFHESILAFIVLQIIVLAIGKVYLAKLSYLLTNNNLVFYSVFILLNITPYFSQYQNLILTESLGFSFLIFYLYNFFKIIEFDLWQSRVGFKGLLLSGVFLSVAIMLRPFLALFTFPVFLFLAMKLLKQKKYFIKPFLVFFIPFTLLFGSWIIRNYIKTEGFIPLASTMKFQDHKHKATFKMMDYCKLKGVSDRWFDINSPLYWLVEKDDNRVYSEVVPEASREEVKYFTEFKDDFRMSLSEGVEETERINLELKLESSLDSINNKYRLELGMGSIFLIKLKSTFDLLNQRNLRFFHSITYPFNVLFVTMQSIILKLIFIVGVITIVFVTFMFNGNIPYWLISIPVILLIVFFGLYAQTIEHRELYTYSSLLLMSAVIWIWKVFSKNKKWGWFNLSLIIVFVSLLGVSQMFGEISW